ncbi:MAG: tetratricopeptide repeat protein [Kiritimatiellia bacterium]
MTSTEKSSKTGWPTKLFIAFWAVALLAVLCWYAPEFWRDAVDYYNKAVSLQEKGRNEEALKPLSRAIKMDPENTGYLTTRGNIQLGLKDYAGAEETFRQIIVLDPDAAEALFGLVETSRRQEQRDAALEWLDQMAGMTLTREHKLRRAQIYADMQAQAPALACITDLLKETPDDTVLLKESAAMKSALQDFAGAAADYMHLASVLKEGDEQRAALAGAAVSHRAMKNPQEAYKLFQQIAGKDNLQARAELASELGLNSDAASFYEELLTDEPGNLVNGRALAVLYETMKEHIKAANRLEKVQALEPNPEQLLKIANLYRWGGKPEKAVPFYLSYVKDCGEDRMKAVPAREGAVRALIELKRGEQALEHLNVLLELAPKNPEVLLLAARAADLTGNPALTVEHLEKLEEVRALQRDEAIWLAGQLRLAGKKKESLGRYEALLAAPDSAGEVEVIEAVGDLRADFNRYAEALKAYAMIPAGKIEPIHHLKIGRAAEKAGEIDLAVAEYGKYLAVKKDDLEARLAMASLYDLQGKTEEAGKLLAEVYPQIREALEKTPKDEALLLLAARAASMSEDPAGTVAYLERLSAIRELTFAERIWMAGQTRAAGEGEKALNLYETLYAESGDMFDGVALEALGDLRQDFGNFAGAMDAYEKISPEQRPKTLSLKLARVAALQSDKVESAVKYYSEYLTSFPDDTEAQLEAARIFVNFGHGRESVELYEKYTAVKGKTGLGLEVSRAYLQAQQFEKAEEWSRFAIEEEGATNWVPHLCLAQSLHLQGKVKDADDIIEDYREEMEKSREGLEWLGLVAIARDRHLEALRTFDKLVENEEWVSLKYWIWRARAATRLGDLARAKESIEKAREFVAKRGGQTMESAEREADTAVEQLKGAEKKGRQQDVKE